MLHNILHWWQIGTVVVQMQRIQMARASSHRRDGRLSVSCLVDTRRTLPALRGCCKWFGTWTATRGGHGIRHVSSAVGKVIPGSSRNWPALLSIMFLMRSMPGCIPAASRQVGLAALGSTARTVCIRHTRRLPIAYNSILDITCSVPPITLRPSGLSDRRASMPLIEHSDCRSITTTSFIFGIQALVCQLVISKITSRSRRRCCA